MLVIIGTGHAGYTLAREWRKLDPASPLTLITRDDGAYYYKPDLSKAFAAGKDAESLIKNPTAEMAQQLKAEIRTGATVTRLLPGEHAVEVNGERLSYRQLVLAVGAEPIRIPLAGDAAGDILSVNNRQDYARFRARLQPSARVLLMGAGLIGCEFANDLGAHGFTVTAVDLAAWPLPRLLPEACGRALQQGLSGLGVRWHLGCSITQLQRNGAGLRAELSDGTAVDADVALSAIGLRPSLHLAKDAGLACNQGIVLDDVLRTSASDVYALGDCVEIEGRPLPFILPIAHGARALAQTLAGKPTPAVFPAMPVTVKTPACPTIVCPPAHGQGAWDIEGNAPDLQAVFKDASGKPLGFALTGAAIAKRGALTALMPPVRAAR